ncbi:FMN-binding protein [Actinoplanes sp. CA-015351]|uniref:FMN-binding protein n=1 Tax=Actinoplanes sp. CA-015351 TaxID=3239897 RepID=UPI003D95BDF5
MRRIALWLLSTVAALVLLFSYRTSTGQAVTPSTVAAAPAAPAASSSGSSGSSGSSSGSKVYTGDTVQTQEGDVQVSITVADGKITAVTVPVYPGGSARHEEISARALPVLVQETLAAQSADIDSVSGATYTSGGYKESLQSALDAAQLS